MIVSAYIKLLISIALVETDITEWYGINTLIGIAEARIMTEPLANKENGQTLLLCIHTQSKIKRITRTKLATHGRRE